LVVLSFLSAETVALPPLSVVSVSLTLGFWLDLSVGLVLYDALDCSGRFESVLDNDDDDDADAENNILPLLVTKCASVIFTMTDKYRLILIILYCHSEMNCGRCWHEF